ncbi:MAG: helix-turn-helix domain-containing protein [Polyangia bacterium]
MTDTRGHIIQIASRLFLQRNYDGVSIQDITQAAGVTKGALYHYFTGKEQLFQEVAHTLVGSAQVEFSSLPDDSLQRFYRALAEVIGAREERARAAHLPAFGINVHNLLWDAVRILPGFRAAMEASNGIEHAAWVGAIKSAVRRGEIRRGLDAADLAKIFMAVPDGVSVTSMLKEGGRSRQAETLHLWNALYQSLKP